ncbi:MAG: hypothetical protein GQ542_09855 [Desulforhopalus sp.]|nr:hypothetical protein [Desulforhopalus sp.]
MRARLTVIGFNIAIVSFQINQLYRVSGGLSVPGVDHSVHVGANMALFMALGLSMIALVAFIMSGTLDEVGYCTHWSLVAADLFMYLALAHTIAGFFQPLSGSIEDIAAKLPGEAAGISVLHIAVLITGGLGWFLATYIVPVVSLVRSPFSRSTNIILGVVYVVVLLLLFWVNAHSLEVETLGEGEGPWSITPVLKEMFQPFRW